MQLNSFLQILFLRKEKLEERYFAEYGFPSTHAMVSAGLPISVLVLSYSRYNIDLPISIAIVVSFCCWVCCSRLYLGMVC